MKSETTNLVTIEAIRAAAARIAGIAVKTPLVRAAFPGLSGYGTQKIWLKAESLQPIGAFKMRGAANKILQLTPEEIRRGVITYSSGNHAQAVAYRGARGRCESRHRHAFERPGHQARCHSGAGCGGRRCGRRLQRAPGHGRETGPRARLRGRAALRRRADHRRPGHLRPGDRRSPA